MELTTKEVSQITGASYRQLQWWNERGWIKCRIEGGYRYWSEEALHRAAVYARIGKLGRSLMKRMAKLSDAVFAHRFFIFRGVEEQNTVTAKSLIAATDDPAEVIRISAA